MALRNIGAYTIEPKQLRIVRGQRRNVDAIAAAYPWALAATAAPMYGRTASRSCGGALNPCTALYDRASGVSFPGVFRDSGLTISVKGNRASVANGAQVPPGADVAVQLYPTIVRAGVASGPGTAESSVAGVGLLRNGKLLLMVAGGGSPFELGQEFVRRGAEYAGYTDAGSSAALWVRGEGWRGAHAANPSLPGWLLVGPPPKVNMMAWGAIVAGVLLALGGAGLLAKWYFKGVPDAMSPKTFNRRRRRRRLR